MNIKVRLSSICIIVVVCVLIFSVFQSQASAKNAVENAPAVEAFRSDLISPRSAPISGGPGFVSITGTSFTQMTGVHPFSWDFILYNPEQYSSGAYAAPVMLPQGATVNKFVVYYYDVADANFTADLFRVDLGNGDWAYMASASSQMNWGYGAMSDTSINLDKVDNQSFAYFVRVLIPGDQYGDLGLVGVRVDYTFPGYLPCVSSN